MGNDFCNQTGVDEGPREQSVDNDEHESRADKKIDNNKKIEPPHKNLARRLDDLPLL